jgi:hypothetical protein
MRFGRWIRAALVAALALGPSGCLFLPRSGTPVYVDRLAGKFWDGAGMLTEVSPDGRLCRVYVRNTAGVVEGDWYPCERVHPRSLN